MPAHSLTVKDRRKAPIFRSWWTRERVLSGLRRLHADTGHAPNCSGGSYLRLMRELGQSGLKGGRRRYPTDQAVLRYWPTLAHAWRELGITPDGKRVPTTWRAARGGVGWAVRHEAGERHGRLTVIEFAGYRDYRSGRRGVWRCRCDCGGERLVEVGNFKVMRECVPCTRQSWLARRRAKAAAKRAARGATEHRRTAACVPTTSLAGATEAPRETSPGWASGRGGPESMPALLSSLQERV